MYCNNNPLAFVDPTGLATLKKLKNSDNGSYQYSAGNKMIDVYTSFTGAIPYIGIGADIGTLIGNIPNIYDEVDFDNKRQVEKIFGKAASAGTILGYVGELVNYCGKASKILGPASKVLGTLSNFGSAVGVVKGFMHVFDKSYKVEKAVELSGFVNDTDLEKAIAKSIYAEMKMSDMLENGQVEFIKDDYGNKLLQWNDKEAFKEYRQTLIYGFDEKQEEE